MSYSESHLERWHLFLTFWILNRWLHVRRASQISHLTITGRSQPNPAVICKSKPAGAFLLLAFPIKWVVELFQVYTPKTWCKIVIFLLKVKRKRKEKTLSHLVKASFLTRESKDPIQFLHTIRRKAGIRDTCTSRPPRSSRPQNPCQKKIPALTAFNTN